MNVKVSPYPVPELKEFLRSFRQHFYRAESLHTLERYATGLLADVERKSGAGIAEAVAGLSDSALYRLMTETCWDFKAFNRQRIQIMLERAMAGDGVLVVDDTWYPRQGERAVGVAPQYWGVLGKTANGQVVVTTRYVDPYYAWDINGQLYLTEKWCQDIERRRRAGIPDDVTFQSKPAIALGLIDEAREAGVPFNIVISDSSYGDNPTFLDGLDTRNLSCVVAVACDFGVRLPEEVEAAAKQPQPVQLAPLHRVDEVLATQPEEAWQTITWRMGTDGPLTKQFVALRVYRAVGETTGPEGWLIGERPLPGHKGKIKFYWSDLPVTTPLARLAELSHRRPSVERGYQDGKGFTGLDAYAARKWDSFHRHLAIDMLVLSWLALQRPPVENPVIVLEPQAVQSPNEPIFPLRA